MALSENNGVLFPEGREESQGQTPSMMPGFAGSKGLFWTLMFELEWPLWAPMFESLIPS